jgi:hypothetical protein
LLAYKKSWEAENNTSPGSHTFYDAAGYGSFINIPTPSGVIQLKVRVTYEGNVRGLSARVYTGSAWGPESSF